MTDGINWWLVAGGVSSGAAALAHLACVFGGAAWYRAMGAPAAYVRAASHGEWTPAAVTLGIAAILTIFAVYALLAAGPGARLPLHKVVLMGITAVYLARGLILFAPALLGRPDLSPTFIRRSSAIVLAMGIVHAAGVWNAWNIL